MPLQIARKTFRPTWWGFALAALACAAGVALGNWQARRAEERRAAEHKRDAALRAPAQALPGGRRVAAPAYAQQRVAATGEFVDAYTVLLENKLRHGRVGYEVLTPLRLEGGTLHVLVNRGWVAALSRRDVLPEISTPRGRLRVEGIALEHLPQALEFGTAPQTGPTRTNLRLEDYAAATGLALQPIVLEQHSDSGDGLLREWPAEAVSAQKNEMYSLQWYSLSALAVVLFVVLSFRRERDIAN